jgi:nucleoid DNA-binding protein
MENNIVNIKELARRVAYRGGYTIKDTENVLNLYSDVLVEALEAGELVKHGNLFKLSMEIKAAKRAWNGLAKEYYTIPAKKIPKMQLLSGIKSIELPVTEDDTGEL